MPLIRCWRRYPPVVVGVWVLACSWAVPVAAQSILPPGGAPVGGTGPIGVEGYLRAVQGDTLDVRVPGGRFAVGVVGIRAPRGNTPCGKESAAFVQNLVLEGARLSEEAGLVFDGRSRRMYHVTTLDGRSLAEEVVAAGFARADGQGSNRERLTELEAAARAAGRGCLWQAGSSP